MPPPHIRHACPIGPAHLCPICLAHFPHRTGTPPPLIPARPRAPDPTRLRPSARSASAPQPASRSNCNLSTRSQQESYMTRIQQGRGRRRSRLSPASTACFHGVSNRTHSSSRTHSSGLNKCLHNFEGHSSTSMLLSCWRIKLGSNPKGSHSISTHGLRRFKQGLRQVCAEFT
jgi:hypothetical protein